MQGKQGDAGKAVFYRGDTLSGQKSQTASPMDDRRALRTPQLRSI